MKVTKDATQIARAIGSSTTYNNSGGALPAGTDTIQEAIDAIAGGMAGLYLTVIGGGQGTVQPLGTLGATKTIDLTNANLFWGTLDQDCTISFTGWTNLKDCQITVILFEDGTGGWTPTFSGVTWDGGTPTHDTTAGTFTRYVFTSIDGGTTIIGAQTGGGGGSALTIKDEGSSLATAATSLDFVGAGVTASGTGAAKTITIPSTGIQLASITAASSAIAATEAVVVSASLPANSIVAGNSYRITGAGVGTTGATPGTDAFRIRIGPTTLTGTIPTTVSALGIAVVTAQPFRFEAIITLRTSGGSGTIIGECVVEADNVATGRYAVLNSLSTTTASVAVDTTVANLLELTFQSGNAGSSNTFHVASIEQLTLGSFASAPDCYEAFLAADVSITTAGTFQDIVSVSLPTGVYWVTGEAEATSASGSGTFVTLRIYDGTTVWAAKGARCWAGDAGGAANPSVSARVVVSGTTTVHIQGTSIRSTGDTIFRDQSQANGTADKCTVMHAFRITAA